MLHGIEEVAHGLDSIGGIILGKAIGQSLKNIRPNTKALGLGLWTMDEWSASCVSSHHLDFHL